MKVLSKFFVEMGQAATCRLCSLIKTNESIQRVDLSIGLCVFFSVFFFSSLKGFVEHFCGS